MLLMGWTEVFEIVWVYPAFPVEPYLNTINDDSEISAEAFPLREAFADEF